MPEQALYLKYRPLNFDDVVGQEHITRTLRNSIKTNRIRHAYLFSGPRGTGKTTSARLLAKAVNCTHPDPIVRPCNECAVCVAVNEGRFLDLIEIDAASHTGVDDVRDLRDKIAFAPNEGKYKVYIIDEVHRFSGNAFDALLKTLEEPPDHALFVLATTEIDRVPATIKSRCLPFEFRRLSLREVTEQLGWIASNEGLQIDPGALELIAREGTGSVRDSISLLDQIVADPEEAITLELAQRVLGTASVRAVRQLAEAIIQRNTAQGLHIINSAIDAGSDPRQFGQQLVEHLRSVLLSQTASSDLLEASQDDCQLFESQARMIGRKALLKAIRAFNEAVNAYAGGWQPQLDLELALIESTQAEDEPMPMVAAPSPPVQARSSPVYESPEPAAPGEPAVITMDAIRGQWDALMKAIYRYNPNVPAMMTHVYPHNVSGNRVIFGTENQVFVQKLLERREHIEQALLDVHKVKLVAEFVLTKPGSVPAVVQSESDDPLAQELRQLGGEMQPPVRNGDDN